VHALRLIGREGFTRQTQAETLPHLLTVISSSPSPLPPSLPPSAKMVKTSLLVLALAAVAQGFLLPVPLQQRTQTSTQLAAAAFTTVSGRVVEDPKGELQKVLTPSPKDEARRARVAKLLEAAGLTYTGEAIFPSNR